MTTMIDFTPAPAYSMEPSNPAAPEMVDDTRTSRVSKVHKWTAYIVSILVVGALLGMEIHYFWNQAQLITGGWARPELWGFLAVHAAYWFLGIWTATKVYGVVRHFAGKAGK